MIEYSTVYGRFYSNTGPVQGTVVFTPLHRTVDIGGIVCILSPIVGVVEDGVLLYNGTPGITLPASSFGLGWSVKVFPLGFSNVLQSYPGDIISLGE